MGLLVGDLLFLARAGQGRPVAREPVDLVRLAGDAVQDARAVDPSRSIALEAPDRLVIQGDEARLRQVLGNLLSNALTHTPAGSPVSVKVTGDVGWAEISVRDGGPGLTPEEAAHVFEPFYRADPSRGRMSEATSGDGAGTGLGLAIVAAIAEAHGGSAGVSSQPGEGSTFTVRVPIAGALPPPPS